MIYAAAVGVNLKRIDFIMNIFIMQICPSARLTQTSL
jgi:hypothetical protein